MNSKSSFLSFSLSDDEFFNENLQPYSYETSFTKTPVIFNSKHDQEEETDN